MNRPADWYKDAVIYELHVRSFADSTGDGMGDFKGLTGKLDYLADLGVTALWLLPFYPSPWFDDGYDISDYTQVHTAYGTLQDFKRLLKEAHARDMQVITELVINHTSNQHPWFDRARRAKPGSKFRDYYVWSDTPDLYADARIIFKDTETSNWAWDPVAKAYYWHRFYSNQPDLNFENIEVQNAVLKVLDFWFKMGVDGLRLDAVPYLFEREGTNCENLPETHEFLRKMRSHVDTNHPGCMLLAEANQWPEDSVKYFGDNDECHMCFHFPLMPRLFMGVKREDRFPIIDILEQTPDIPPSAQWGIFLRNHDELTLEMVTDEERDYMYQVYARDPRQRLNVGIRRRLAPLLDNDRRLMELLNVLLMSLPGTPVLYYGDEIGMGDNVYLGDRDGVRTPMQWTPDRNAGFSAANPQKLYLPVNIDPEYHYESINVATQQENPSSLLWWTKRLLATRKRYRAFSRGKLTFVPSSNTHVLSYLRETDDEKILCVVNLSRHVQMVDLDLREHAGHQLREVFGQNEFNRIPDDDFVLTIGGYDYFWFELVPPVDHRGSGSDGDRVLTVAKGDWKRMSQKLLDDLGTTVLPAFVETCRWFRSKSRKVRRTRISDCMALGEDRVCILTYEYADRDAEHYQLPIAVATGEEADELDGRAPESIICPIQYGGADGYLYDATFSPAFRSALLELLLRKRKLKSASGEFAGITAGRSRSPEDGLRESKVLGVEQSNTSIIYGNSLFLKLYRKLEPGENPDVELIRKLSAPVGAHGLVPTYRGHLTYQWSGKQGGSSAAGLMVDFVANEGDAWAFTRGAVDRYLEFMLSSSIPPEQAAPKQKSIFDSVDDHLTHPFIDAIDGYFLEMIRTLGRQSAELHVALGNIGNDVQSAPEPFSLLYQRGMYQSSRALLKQVLQRVRKTIKKVDNESAAHLEFILASEEAIVDRLSRIRDHKIDAKKTRIHGDYHLGQVLFTGRDFVVIDMEGEPARPISERRLKFSPFRDVAGMLRSFHYAIWAGYLGNSGLSEQEELHQWLEPWYLATSSVYLQSYFEAIGDSDLVPRDGQDRRVLLELFLLEKAIYELGYELDNRPDWLRIPLEGIRYIIG